MSSVAAFYTIPRNLELDLIAASKIEQKVTTKGFLFLKREKVETFDMLGEFLSDFGQEQSPFEFSGHTFTYLEIFLEDNGVGLYRFEKNPESGQFRDGRDGHGSLFDVSAAKQTLEALRAAKLSNSAIQAFIKEDYPEEDTAAGAEAILNAALIMEVWLDSVKEDEIGLFVF
jgi:hypothetical protein